MRQGKTKIESDLSLATGGTIQEISTVLGNTDTALPTEKAVKDYVDSLTLGLDWQESVLNQINFVTSEPSSPNTGDRYINTATGISSQTSQSVTINHIYEWNGTSWNDISPDEGFATWDESQDVLYTFNGTSWVKFGSTVSHENLLGIQGGTTNERYHLTAQEHTDVLDLLQNPPQSDGLSNVLYQNWESKTVNSTTNSTYDIIDGKFWKTSSVNTLTVYCLIYPTSGNGGVQGTITLTVNSLSNLVYSNALPDSTPTWKSFTLDVSSLTNGVVYDMLIQLGLFGGSSTRIAKCDRLIVFGS